MTINEDGMSVWATGTRMTINDEGVTVWSAYTTGASSTALKVIDPADNRNLFEVSGASAGHIFMPGDVQLRSWSDNIAYFGARDSGTDEAIGLSIRTQYLDDAGDPTVRYAMFLSQTGDVAIGGYNINPTADLDIIGDRIRLRTNTPPATAAAAGYTGEIRWGAGKIYLCVSGDGSTGSWVRFSGLSW